MTHEENMRLTFLNVRDVFANSAMQTLLARAGPETEVGMGAVAAMAYDMADAMMQERAKRDE